MKKNFYLCAILGCLASCSRMNSLPKAKKLSSQAAHEQYFEAKKFVAATQGVHASNAAKEIFERGGNTFDAAIAASFVLAVERPQSTGIGGGGFATLFSKKENKVVFLDFRETAPSRAHPKMYFDSSTGELKKINSSETALSWGVPGFVKGLLQLHADYGSLSLEKVLEPAIQLATQGFKVYAHLHEAIKKRSKLLKKSSASYFFDSEGEALKVGDLLVQKELAQTLKQIVQRGMKAFYEGSIAQKIEEASLKEGGILRKQDLAAYKAAYKNPICDEFKGKKVCSAPLPSSGGLHVLQILKSLEQSDLNLKNPLDISNVQKFVVSMQAAFLDRGSYLGDSDFVKVPVEKLLSDSYLSKRIGLMKSSQKALSSEDFQKIALNLEESPETVHASFMDVQGNAIAVTTSINWWFGSGSVIPGTGIVMNNHMNDFSLDPGDQNLWGAVGGSPNRIQGNKKPLSSMTPTLVLKKDAKGVLSPEMALGTPAGTKILTCVAQTLVNRYAFGLSLKDSVNSIRYHHQLKPDVLKVTAPGFPRKLHAQLKERGYTIEVESSKNKLCKIQATALEEDKLLGVSDRRGEGLAIGL